MVSQGISFKLKNSAAEINSCTQPDLSTFGLCPLFLVVTQKGSISAQSQCCLHLRSLKPGLACGGSSCLCQDPCSLPLRLDQDDACITCSGADTVGNMASPTEHCWTRLNLEMGFFRAIILEVSRYFVLGDL